MVDKFVEGLVDKFVGMVDKFVEGWLGWLGVVVLGVVVLIVLRVVFFPLIIWFFRMVGEFFIWFFRMVGRFFIWFFRMVGRFFVALLIAVLCFVSSPLTIPLIIVAFLCGFFSDDDDDDDDFLFASIGIVDILGTLDD
ncbi:hypothetical protein Taitung233_09880 [Helicobacter pylori]